MRRASLSEYPVAGRSVENEANESSLTSCYAVWHPSGAYFAIPTRINGTSCRKSSLGTAELSEVGIINREGWTKGHTYASDGPKTVSATLSSLSSGLNSRPLAS